LTEGLLVRMIDGMIIMLSDHQVQLGPDRTAIAPHLAAGTLMRTVTALVVTRLLAVAGRGAAAKALTARWITASAYAAQVEIITTHSPSDPALRPLVLLTLSSQEVRTGLRKIALLVWRP